MRRFKAGIVFWTVIIFSIHVQFLEVWSKCKFALEGGLASVD